MAGSGFGSRMNGPVVCFLVLSLEASSTIFVIFCFEYFSRKKIKP